MSNAGSSRSRHSPRHTGRLPELTCWAYLVGFPQGSPCRLTDRGGASLVRRALTGCALVSALLIITGTTAFAAPVVHRASDPEPAVLAACTLGQGPPTAGAEFNYRDSEVEPYVAVNPADLSNVIGVWQQDRWSDGGARGLVAGFSTEGGQNFKGSSRPFHPWARP